MTIKAFGYIFKIKAALYRHRRSAPSVSFGSPSLSEPVCKIAYDTPYYYLLTPDGMRLPYQLSLTIKERLNKPTVATVKLYINGTNQPIKNYPVETPGGVKSPG
jgi:hypothetical protein